MDEDGSFEAFEVQNPKLQEELEEEDEDEEDDEDEEEEDEGEEEEEEEERFCELQSSVASVGVEFGESQYETLAVPSSIAFSESDHFADFAASSSEFLTGFPVNSASELQGSAEFKEQVAASHQEVLVGVIVHDAENQIPNLVCSSKLSPTSVTQSILSAPSQITPGQILSVLPKGNNENVPEADHQNSSKVKTISAVPIVKTPSADGYNWRKYGQKQVKSPKGARSYYKCTNSECSSKKIECCDHLGVAIEIVYKGRHNHEPPRKVNSTKEGRVASSAGPDVRNSLIAHPVKLLNDPDSSSKEPIQDVSSIPDRKRQNATDTDGNAEIKVEEEQFVEPESKRRLKSSPSYPGSVLKVVKKSKLVVHAAGDVGISSDGYRWRKYGQKMVKGNPHPRNYYRCTSAGCSVRKHIESAVDNASALIITYKGVHDHDMPVPKKRHGPPSAHLVAAAAPVSMNNLQFKNSDALQSQISPTQWSVDTAGELKGKTFDIGGEKSMESARTLLSIGFEIKPC